MARVILLQDDLLEAVEFFLNIVDDSLKRFKAVDERGDRRVNADQGVHELDYWVRRAQLPGLDYSDVLAGLQRVGNGTLETGLERLEFINAKLAKIARSDLIDELEYNVRSDDLAAKCLYAFSKVLLLGSQISEI